MDTQFTSLFAPGIEIAKFVSASGILSKAWKEIGLARQRGSYEINESEGVTYVSFPSFEREEYFIPKDSTYGETDINSEDGIFSTYFKGNDDQPAVVHQGALKLFSLLMKNTDFPEKLKTFTDQKQTVFKSIIFVGHSLGGAVASLATLWLLEKKIRHIWPFCITVGSTLVGDLRFSQALSREHWTGNFCHMVHKTDIVSRIFFFPLAVIADTLKVILRSRDETISASSLLYACRIFSGFILNSYPMTSIDHASINNGIDKQLRECPYRPFGHCILCSSSGSTCIDNSDTLFKILLLTIVRPDELSVENLRAFIGDYDEYGCTLEKVVECSVLGNSKALLKSELSYEAGISLQLEAVGIGSQNEQAWNAFKKASETEERHIKNVAKLSVDLCNSQCAMAELEWYKWSCKDGIGYYDSFKNQCARKDMRSNLHRLKLETIWDDIIAMWERQELPCDFHTRNKYINAGTAYRRIVEPLDIANYYRKGRDNYLLKGRPKRYIVLEKWLQDKENSRASRGNQKKPSKLSSLTLDSCFWAHVEEALKHLEDLREGSYTEEFLKFEDYIKKVIVNKSVSGEIFLKESSFMLWWNAHKQMQLPEWRQSSALCQIIEEEIKRQEIT